MFPSIISKEDDNTPLGSMRLFSSNQGNLITTNDGKKYLKSGVIAPKSDFPSIPDEFCDYLGAPLQTKLGSGGIYTQIMVDPYGGTTFVLDTSWGTSGAGTVYRIEGTSETSTADVTAFLNPDRAGQPGAYTTYVHAVGGVVYTFGDRNNDPDAPVVASDISTCNDLTVGLYPVGGTGDGGFIVPAAHQIKSMSTGAGIQHVLLKRVDGTATATAYYGNRPTWTLGNMPSSQIWTDCCFGTTTALFVAVASGGTVAASSPNGFTWTTRTLPASASWSSVATDGTNYVAVSSGSTQGALSTNGTTWTSVTLPSSANWQKVAFGNGLWVAVAGGTNGSNAAATSTDGTNWTARTLPATANWVDVKWSTGLQRWVAVADCGRAGVITSADAITWTAKAMPTPLGFSMLRGNSSNMIAIATPPNGGYNFIVARSTDQGATWTYYRKWFQGTTTTAESATSYGPIQWRVAFANSRFVIVSAAGTTAGYVVYHSTDGLTWTKVQVTSTLARATPNAIAWNGTAWMISHPYSSSVPAASNKFGYSTDLVTFSEKTMPVTAVWTGISAFGNVFLTLSPNGSWTNIWTSTDGTTWTSRGNHSMYLTALTQYSTYNAELGMSYVKSQGYICSYTKFEGQIFQAPGSIVGGNRFEAVASSIKVGPNRVAYNASGAIVARDEGINTFGGGSAVPVKTYSAAISLSGTSNFWAHPTAVGDDHFMLSSAGPFLLKVDKRLYIDNTRAGTEASGAMTYYMRVA